MTQRVNLCFRNCSRESSSYCVKIGGSRNAERKFTPRIKDKGESNPPVALGWNRPRPSLWSIYKLRKRVVTRETVVCHVMKGLIITHETQVNRSKMRGKKIWCTFNSSLIYNMNLQRLNYVLLFSEILKKKACLN